LNIGIALYFSSKLRKNEKNVVDGQMLGAGGIS